MFCPDYYDGYCPFGQWYASHYYALNGWIYKANHAADLGAVILNPNASGTQIVNYVGGQGIAWNQPYSEYFTDLGYPAAPPFTGEQLEECAGSTTRTDSTQTPASPGLACNMTGGSSGGSWYIHYGSNGGLRNGHNDYSYSGLPGVIFSPYYGNGVANLYSLAG
jgi:hypothetical protein